MLPCLERITLRESGKWGISDLAWAVTNSELSFSKHPEGIGHMYLSTQRLGRSTYSGFLASALAVELMSIELSRSTVRIGC